MKIGLRTVKTAISAALAMIIAENWDYFMPLRQGLFRS